MKCSEVRWQLSRFLNGATTPTEDELIRDHLDSCADCALRLASSHRVDSLKAETAPAPQSDLTKRVLSYFPESPTGMMMVRHLVWVFGVSASFAVCVFVFVREMLASPPGRILNPVTRLEDEGITGLVSLFTNNPLINYVSLAVLATLLCVALVLFVDRPSARRGSHSTARR